MVLFKDLLFNLLFILITSFIVQYFFMKYKSNLPKNLANWLIIIAAAIQVFFCIHFSYTEDNQIFYDLRVIPIILVGLYSGIPSSICIFFLSLLLRVPFGGVGIWLHVALMVFITLTVSVLSKYFRRNPMSRKLSLVAVITVSYSLLSFIFASLLDTNQLDVFLSIIYTMTLLAGVMIVVFLIELILQNIILRDAVVKSDKIEVISHLAASVSHEVRNPLTVTRGFLQMLKDPSIPEEKRQFYLDTAIDELDRAEVILKDYLSFSKPQHHQVSMLNVKTEIEKSLELLSPYANHNSVKVTKNLTEGLYINGDAAKFQQCLLNILKNGIEAMPNGGTLTVQVNQSKTSKSIIINIEDTGIGMSASQLAKLGEPYFSTKKDKGTGLGMLVAFKILKEMNGFVDSSSEVNKGTRFTLIFPMINLPYKSEILSNTTVKGINY
jgi:two-component system, sporulation sensor kinase B